MLTLWIFFTPYTVFELLKHIVTKNGKQVISTTTWLADGVHRVLNAS